MCTGSQQAARRGHRDAPRPNPRQWDNRRVKTVMAAFSTTGLSAPLSRLLSRAGPRHLKGDNAGETGLDCLAALLLRGPDPRLIALCAVVNEDRFGADAALCSQGKKAWFSYRLKAPSQMRSGHGFTWMSMIY